MVKKLRVNEGCHTKKEGFSGLDFDAMLAEVGGDFEELKAIMDARPFNPIEMMDFSSWLATNDDYMARRERKEVERKLRKYGEYDDDALAPGEKWFYGQTVLTDTGYNRKLESRKRRMHRSSMTEANKGYSSAVYQALDEDFMDGWSKKVDPVYVSDQVELWLMNDKPCYDNIFNTRMKAHSVAYAAMLSLFQDVVDRYDVKVRVTSEMAKQWLKRNGMDYKEVLKPVVARVEEEREERKAETKESVRRRRRTMKESAWVAPNGKKYGMQKKSRFPYAYIFTRRELKDMVRDGVAIEITNPDEAINLYGDMIGFAWNETNGYKSGVLFKGKDGNLYVGNTGVATVIG